LAKAGTGGFAGVPSSCSSKAHAEALVGQGLSREEALQRAGPSLRPAVQRSARCARLWRRVVGELASSSSGASVTTSLRPQFLHA
jgi:hypothetical protein